MLNKQLKNSTHLRRWEQCYESYYFVHTVKCTRSNRNSTKITYEGDTTEWQDMKWVSRKKWWWGKNTSMFWRPRVGHLQERWGQWTRRTFILCGRIMSCPLFSVVSLFIAHHPLMWREFLYLERGESLHLHVLSTECNSNKTSPKEQL